VLASRPLRPPDAARSPAAGAIQPVPTRAPLCARRCSAEFASECAFCVCFCSTDQASARAARAQLSSAHRTALRRTLQPQPTSPRPFSQVRPKMLSDSTSEAAKILCLLALLSSRGRVGQGRAPRWHARDARCDRATRSIRYRNPVIVASVHVGVGAMVCNDKAATQGQQQRLPPGVPVKPGRCISHGGALRWHGMPIAI
jgi:hypothetical protein